MAHQVLAIPAESNSLKLSPPVGVAFWVKGLPGAGGLRFVPCCLSFGEGTLFWCPEHFGVVLNSSTKRDNPGEHLTLQLSDFTVTECPLFSPFSNNALMGLTWTVPLGNA